MDAVITYVNGADPIWQKEYNLVTNKSALQKRYRDWGLLPFLLRGIEQYMPFIENVFLVVSSDSQVPLWINRKNLHVILHKDIIPQKHLPTFNSTTIELFIHKITGLSEEFIYFNDDFFPISPLQKNDFFIGEKAVIHFSHHIFALGMYKKQCKASDSMARIIANQNTLWGYIRPQHTCAPMLKSSNEHVYNSLESELSKTISPLRKDYNVNQYLYSDYLYYTNKTLNKRLATKHCSMAVYSASKIAEFIKRQQSKIICINDVTMNESKILEMRSMLHEAFNSIFPNKSKFEK